MPVSDLWERSQQLLTRLFLWESRSLICIKSFLLRRKSLISQQSGLKLNQPEQKKGPSKALFVSEPISLGQPGLNCRGAVLCFPLFQSLVVAAFGFNKFASVRIFINLQLARLATAGFGLGSWSATTCLRIKKVDHVLQAVAVFCEQIAQLRFEFDFFLEASITLEGFERLELFGEVFLELADFRDYEK
ncbi:hypothetical protein A8L59_18110 [Pseudomonas koreensis]|uniref:Uncharacterized protein n=1 Tax=Pseudomonas koreensis TaxID=198620 RepID=A0AAC9FXS9_9PSED|nr:hypothetical protein A8L59_18110 [Pseudomonas koreensis]